MGTPRLIDLSHAVEDGMVTYRGLPAPVVCDFLGRKASRAHYAAGTEFHIGRIDMVANTGTYVDAPFHRFADGKDLAELPLSSLAHLDAVVVRIERGQRAVDAGAFDGLDLRGKAVLVDTGWSAHWRTDRYFEGTPSSRPPPPATWPTRARRWSASTRSTSTTPTTARARSTRRCWAKRSRSSST